MEKRDARKLGLAAQAEVRRVVMGLSQDKLAERLGITFQQNQ
ncbi:MAG: hypothetical protein ACK6BL_00565 [Holosporaceae bacterium]